MHTHRDVGTSAVAITVGLGQLNESHPICAWKDRVNAGFVELYTDIGALAEISSRTSDMIASCVEFHCQGFPGVYAYEVDEALGASLVEVLGDSDESMTGPKVLLKLGELTLDFFKQVDRPIPITREIIKVMTGYVEPGYVAPQLTFDNTQALAEGWDLFDVDGRLQLQRIDDPAACESLGYTEPMFNSDADAVIHVAAHAVAGSKYHRTALELIGTLAE